MTKIVTNNRAGGFKLSHEAILLYSKLKNLNIVAYIKIDTQSPLCYKKMQYEERPLEDYSILYCNVPKEESLLEYVDSAYITEHYFVESFIDQEKLNAFRADPALVEVVSALGSLANGEYSSLKIVEIPNDIHWYINVLDNGYENIHEAHRVWEAN